MPQYKYKVKNGEKWMTKFTYINPKTGQKESEYKRGFDTKRAAKKYEEDFLECLDDDFEQNCDRSKRTFFDVYQEYHSSYKMADLKYSTKEMKQNIFYKHVFPWFKDYLITNITADDVAAWQQDLKAKRQSNGKPYSEAFLRSIQSQFNAVINYALGKKYILSSPMVDLSNMGRKTVRMAYWSPEQYEKFAFCAMQNPRFYYAFEVLYWTGMREGEMLALTIDDVDFDNLSINISKTYQRHHGEDFITPPKTPTSVRTVKIPKFLAEEIQEYVDMGDSPYNGDRLFPVQKDQLAKHLRLHASEAGIPSIPIHGLRHSHVSLLISRKYDIFEVSRRIGHKSVSTTQDIYGHLFDSIQKHIADDLDNMKRGADHVY